MNTNDLPTVQFLICSHDEAAERRNICEHLAADHSLDYYQRFTGHGLLYHFVCPGCGQIPVDTVTPIRGVCLNCFTDFGEDRNFLGVLGRPEILVCPSGLSFSHETVTLGQPLGEVILAIGTRHDPRGVMVSEGFGQACKGRGYLDLRLAPPLIPCHEHHDHYSGNDDHVSFHGFRPARAEQADRYKSPALRI